MILLAASSISLKIEEGRAVENIKNKVKTWLKLYSADKT